ncbi:MAG: VWA domain-containing protein [Nostoc sp.]|uniref:vWA domain-containing protein n=1 Tax=Nostoc sp. TaxID=1180 RepID=UPI002FF4DC73
MPVGLPEFVENPENRCPVILLLDTSGSMSGQPIQELNQGLAAFKEDVLKDSQASLSVEVAMITFGPIVKLTQDFVTIDQFIPPTLEVGGLTPMGAAIEYALDFLENRKQTYKDNGILYYRPWVFLITDGAPSPSDPWQSAAQRMREAEAQRRLLFFAVGVQGADMNILKQISSPERPPIMLNGLDFREMFVWLSASMKRVSSGKVGQAVALPAMGWGQISS